VQFVNNLYVPGPASRTFTLMKPDPGDPDRAMRAHMSGNVLEGKPEIAADNWLAYVGSAEGQQKVKSIEPLFESYVTTHSATELLDDVLDDVGATLPRRDAVDQRVVDDVRRRRHSLTGSRANLPGIIDSQADAGGWPEYRSAEPPADMDHDGVPDAWELSHDLDPRDPTDGATYRADGYTNLELYLHELCKPQARASK
jgi:hypothetical protein